MCGPARCWRSPATALSETDADAIAHDQVIDHPDVDQRQRIAQAPGDELIGLTRLGDARWVVVSENERRRASLERAFHDFARVHARAVDRAAEQLLEAEQTVAVVEEQAAYLNLPDAG